MTNPSPRCLSAVILLAAIGAGPTLGAPPGLPARPVSVVSSSGAVPAPEPPMPLLLEDAAEPFSPKTPPTEADRDRLHAMALFSTARALEKRQEFAAALRHYQRALRYDPSSRASAEAAVVLADRLQRSDERHRYLLRAAELDPAAVDPVELIDLTDIVDHTSILRRVITIFEKVIAEQDDAEPSPIGTVLQWRLGELYLLDEQYAKAAACADQVIKALDHPEQFGLDEQLIKQLLSGPRPPQDVFAEYYLLAELPDKAEAAFRAADRLKPNPPLLAFYLARVDVQRKKYDEALAHLQQCLEKPSSVLGSQPYELLAEILDKLGRKDELVGRLERILALDTDNVALGYFLAEQYRAAGDMDKARALFVKLLAIKPSIVGYVNLAAIDRQKDRVEDLLGLLADAVEKTMSLDPLEDEAQAIADNDALVDKLADTARHTPASDAEPHGPHAALSVALLAMRAERFDLAREFFEHALKQSPDENAELLLLWGGELLAAEQWADAAAVFHRGAATDGPADDQAAFYYYLSTAMEMQGKTDEALDAAAKAVGLVDDSPRMAAHVAWILFHAKRTPQAIEAYNTLIERCDSDHATAGLRDILREARLIAAHLHILENKPAEAQERLEQVLDEFPDDVSALNDLGYLWADRGEHLERALTMVRAAVEAEPDNAAYRDSLGWALFRLGRLDEAAAELQRAADDADPPEGEIFDHLAQVYKAMNQPDKAADAWRKAADAFRQADKPKQAEPIEAKLEALDAPKP